MLTLCKLFPFKDVHHKPDSLRTKQNTESPRSGKAEEAEGNFVAVLKSAGKKNTIPCDPISLSEPVFLVLHRFLGR